MQYIARKRTLESELGRARRTQVELTRRLHRLDNALQQGLSPPVRLPLRAALCVHACCCAGICLGLVPPGEARVATGAHADCCAPQCGRASMRASAAPRCGRASMRLDARLDAARLLRASMRPGRTAEAGEQLWLRVECIESAARSVCKAWLCQGRASAGHVSQQTSRPQKRAGKVQVSDDEEAEDAAPVFKRKTKNSSKPLTNRLARLPDEEGSAGEGGSGEDGSDDADGLSGEEEEGYGGAAGRQLGVPASKLRCAAKCSSRASDCLPCCWHLPHCCGDEAASLQELAVTVPESGPKREGGVQQSAAVALP